VRFWWSVVVIGSLGCAAPDVRVADVEDLGPLVDDPSIKARDGGYSAEVDGYSVWVYGDSVLTLEGEDGSSWRHNTWSWTADLDLAGGLDDFEQRTDDLGAPVPLFVETQAEATYNAAHQGDDCADPCGARQVLWPGALVADPVRGGALITFVKIHGEPGPWNFHALGSGIAHWPDPTQPVERAPLRPTAEHPTTLFDQDEPIFSTAALVEGEWLYVFGCGGSSAKACTLARVPVADALDRSAWVFWQGSHWGPDLDSAEPVMRAMDIASVHHDARLDLYIAVYSAPLSERVELRTAPELTGPWSSAVHVFDALAAPDGTAPYSALAHAEIDAGDDLLISYYRSLGDWEGEIRLVRVGLDPR